MASGSMATACGPSTQTGTPRCEAAWQIAAIGSVVAVADVTWLATSRRVRSVQAATRCSTSCSAESSSSSGQGNRRTISSAPAAWQVFCHSRRTAPYS